MWVLGSVGRTTSSVSLSNPPPEYLIKHEFKHCDRAPGGSSPLALRCWQYYPNSVIRIDYVSTPHITIIVITYIYTVHVNLQLCPEAWRSSTQTRSSLVTLSIDFILFSHENCGRQAGPWVLSKRWREAVGMTYPVCCESKHRAPLYRVSL